MGGHPEAGQAPGASCSRAAPSARACWARLTRQMSHVPWVRPVRDTRRLRRVRQCTWQHISGSTSTTSRSMTQVDAKQQCGGQHGVRRNQ
eukprot:6024452-Pyramimonas_sp.AAC.1